MSFKGYFCKYCGQQIGSKFDPDRTQQHIFLHHPELEDTYGWHEATRLVKNGKITLTLTVAEFIEMNNTRLKSTEAKP